MSDIATWIQSGYDAMNDDFNSPILIAQLFEAVRYINLIKDGKEQITATDLSLFTASLNAFVFDILGLENVTNEGSNQNQKLNGVVELLIQLRAEARANKDWALSDKIRIELESLGIQLKDGKDGTTFTLQ